MAVSPVITSSPPVEARYPGHCGNCDRAIEVGEEIVTLFADGVPIEGWVHADWCTAW